jgi:hypothetical protein
MAKRPAPRRTKPKKPAPKAKPKAKPARKPKPAAKRKPAPQAKPKAAKKKAARTKPARTEAADRPKVIVFGIDEIPQIARMADAFALAPAVRRSQIYFHDSAFEDQVQLPPDRVCTDEEAAPGLAFLARLAVDLSGRDWKEDVFPLGHIRSWHDVPLDVLNKAFDKCGFDVVDAAAVKDLAGYGNELAVAATLAKQTPAAQAIPDLVFADPFGLTRVSPDGKVSTDTKRPGKGLSIDRDGRLGVLRTAEGNVRVVIELASGHELGALDRGDVMHPTGNAVVAAQPFSFRVEALKRTGAPGAGTVVRNVFPESVPARKPRRVLGGDSIELDCDDPLAFDDDGNYFAWFDAELTADWTREHRSVLVFGRFASAGDDVSVAWHVELRAPERALLSVSIAGGVPVACVRDVATSKVAVAVFGKDGAARVRTIDSVTAPARVGQTLVYQPDATTLLREPLDGGGAARHALSGRAAGRGRVVSRGERWLFVPEHGESVIDLEDGGRERDRGLPAKQAKARASALEMIAKVRTVAADAGMDVTLNKFEEDNGYVSCGLRLAGGGPVLGRAMTNAISDHAMEMIHGALSITGGPGGVLERPATSDEIVELLRVFDRHGLKLASTLFFLDDFYMHALTQDRPEPTQIEPEAEGLLLAAALDEAAPRSDGPKDFDAKLAAWKKHTPTTKEIAERLAALDDDAVNQRSRLIGFIAWITTGRFGREAVDLWLSIPEKRTRFMGVTSSLTWLAKRDKAAFKQLASWFKSLENPHMNWNQLRDALGVPPSAEQEEEDAEQKSREPVAAPAGFDKKAATWDGLASDWAGARALHGLAKDLKADPVAVAKKLGVSALPPSYLEYVKRFYVIGELRKRYERDKFPYFLNLVAPGSLVGERDMFVKSLGAGADISVKQREAREELGGLLPFGTDASRSWICWDPTKTKPDGEMLICFLDGNEVGFGEARTDVGYDLKEVVKYFQPGTFDERG